MAYFTIGYFLSFKLFDNFTGNIERISPVLSMLYIDGSLFQEFFYGRIAFFFYRVCGFVMFSGDMKRDQWHEMG